MVILFSSNYPPLILKEISRLEDIMISDGHVRENIYAIASGVLPANKYKYYLWRYDIEKLKQYAIHWVNLHMEDLPAKNKAEWLLLKDAL